MIDFLWRHAPDLAAIPFAVWVQWKLALRVQETAPGRWRTSIRAAGVAAMIWVAAAFILGMPPVSYVVPLLNPVEWFKGMGLLWAGGTTFAWCLLWLLGRVGGRGTAAGFDPGRRRVLDLARYAAIATPAAAVGYGVFLERFHFRTVEARIRVPGLPKDLDGLRFAQITDIHLGPFFTAPDLRYSVEMANETKPHLALVTGDLVSAHRDPLEECLDLLRGLRPSHGMLGCLGNHEIVANCEDYAALRAAEFGLRFLRDKAVPFEFGRARINFGGVDYQRKGTPYLTRAASLVQPGSFNVLLSHNPDVFPVAAAQGWDLTVAGHTHGGQINVEILGASANIIRFYTPFVYGQYQQDGRQIWVSRGLGTVGVPARFGAPPEVALITLCAT